MQELVQYGNYALIAAGVSLTLLLLVRRLFGKRLDREARQDVHTFRVVLHWLKVGLHWLRKIRR